MKLAVASDLHIEFGDITLVNPGVDVLVLAGDICMLKDLDKESERGDRTRNFFLRVSQDFPKVLYVMGNHEHYSGDFAKGVERFKTFCELHHIYNITLLDKATAEVNGYTFVGGTLWTDFNGADKHTMFHAEQAMNDFRGVKNTNAPDVWKFLPKHALEDHVRCKEYIKIVMSNRRAAGISDNKVVVITHHAPSPFSVHEKYAHDRLMNGNFFTDLTEMIVDNPEIQLWIHGHMHDPFDYTVNQTRVVCNPRGYIQYEQRANEFELQVIELQ